MTNEVGRSMVETLGMLAIMGVLSIVGIWAYGIAMNKNKANNLIQEAQKRAVVVHCIESFLLFFVQIDVLGREIADALQNVHDLPHVGG